MEIDFVVHHHCAGCIRLLTEGSSRPISYISHVSLSEYRCAVLILSSIDGVNLIPLRRVSTLRELPRSYAKVPIDTNFQWFSALQHLRFLSVSVNSLEWPFSNVSSSLHTLRLPHCNLTNEFVLNLISLTHLRHLHVRKADYEVRQTIQTHLPNLVVTTKRDHKEFLEEIVFPGFD